MPSPVFLKRTVDVSVQLPAGTLSVDVAKYISDFFAGKYTIKSIQHYPGRVARVTFVEPEIRSAVEKLERIELNGVLCPRCFVSGVCSTATTFECVCLSLSVRKFR